MVESVWRTVTPKHSRYLLKELVLFLSLVAFSVSGKADPVESFVEPRIIVENLFEHWNPDPNWAINKQKLFPLIIAVLENRISVNLNNAEASQITALLTFFQYTLATKKNDVRNSETYQSQINEAFKNVLLEKIENAKGLANSEPIQAKSVFIAMLFSMIPSSGVQGSQENAGHFVLTELLNSEFKSVRLKAAKSLQLFAQEQAKTVEGFEFGLIDLFKERLYSEADLEVQIELTKLIKMYDKNFRWNPGDKTVWRFLTDVIMGWTFPKKPSLGSVPVNEISRTSNDLSLSFVSKTCDSSVVVVP